jgi:hypothetical protein
MLQIRGWASREVEQDSQHCCSVKLTGAISPHFLLISLCLKDVLGRVARELKQALMPTSSEAGNTAAMGVPKRTTAPKVLREEPGEWLRSRGK